MASEPPIVKAPDRISATRDAAREMVASRPDVSPTGAVYIDLRHCLAVAAPFVNELLDAWPLAQPVTADDDVRDSWDLVVSHRAWRATYKSARCPWRELYGTEPGAGASEEGGQ